MAKLILDLCGGTGSWSKYYQASKDYEVIIVDPFGDETQYGTLIKEDVRLYVPPEAVHGVLAAPPCTHLAGSGARWWADKGDEALLEAMSVVDACLRIIWMTKPKWWALENPVGRLRRYLGKPNLIFNPYYYGDPTIKRTCLWGDFTMPKRNDVEPIEGQVLWKLWPSEDRARLRSITPNGFAKAFFEANP